MARRAKITTHLEFKLIEAGRVATRRMYPTLGMCAMCQETRATHRHHKDLNTTNLDQDNISQVCAKCHRGLHAELRRQFHACVCVKCGETFQSTDQYETTCGKCTRVIAEKKAEYRT